MLVKRKIHDSKMFLDTNDPGQSAELFEGGSREGDCPYILARIVKPGWTCIDIGASLGFYALIEGNCGAKVYAIEANPSNTDILRKSVVLNGYDIEVYNFAAGNKFGRARFMQDHKSNRGFMLDMVAHRPGGIKEVTVEERTLDSFVSDHAIGHIDLLRFDIDGYEREMIEGAQQTLADMPLGSWIFAELHPRCFDNPVKDLKPSLDCIIANGFTPRKGVGPGEQLAKVSASDFALECCTTYRKAAPLVFMEKCG